MMGSQENNRSQVSAVLQRIAGVGLLLTIFVLPFVKTTRLPIVGPKLTIVEIVLMPTIALWLVGRVWDSSRRAVRFTVDILLVGFILTAIASGWTVMHELPTTSALVAFGFEVLTFVYLILFFAMARDLLADSRLFNTSLHVWLLSAGVVGLLGLIGVAELFLCHRPLSSLEYGTLG